jgi:regulatory protein
VPSDIAVRVLSEENEERGNSAEIMQVRRLMKKRGFDLQSASWEERGKMQAYLYRKGYSTSAVRAAMNSESLDSEEFSV